MLGSLFAYLDTFIPLSRGIQLFAYKNFSYSAKFHNLQSKNF